MYVVHENLAGREIDKRPISIKDFPLTNIFYILFKRKTLSCILTNMRDVFIRRTVLRSTSLGPLTIRRTTSIHYQLRGLQLIWPLECVIAIKCKLNALWLSIVDGPMFHISLYRSLFLLFSLFLVAYFSFWWSFFLFLSFGLTFSLSLSFSLFHSLYIRANLSFSLSIHSGVFEMKNDTKRLQFIWFCENFAILPICRRW